MDKRVEQLLDAIKEYIEDAGLCTHAYDDMAVCLSDDCRYCNMVRAYIRIEHKEIE